MKGLGTVIALVAICGLIGFGLWASREDSTTDDTAMESVLLGRHLFGASRIRIVTDPELPALEIEKDAGGRFMLVEPIRDDAAESVLENIARVYDGARMQRRHGASELKPEFLAELELAPPRGEIEVRWDDGDVAKLEFGGVGAFGDEMYVRRGGDVYVTDRALFSCLRVDFADYRDPYAFRNRMADVETLKLDRRLENGDYETLTFEKSGSRFEIVEAGDMPLAQGVVRSTIEAILAIRADRFAVGHASEDLGGGEAKFRIDVHGTRGSEKLDVFTDDEGGGMIAWARPRDVVFQSDRGEHWMALGVPLEQLRSAWLFPVDDVARMNRISIARPDAPSYTFERRVRGFELTAPVEETCNPSATADLVTALGKFIATSFEPATDDLAPYGLDRGYTTLRLEDRTTRGAIVVHVGDTTPEGTFVRRDDNMHVMKVPNESVEPLRRDWVDYVTLEIVRIAIPGAARTLEVHDGDRVRRFSRVEGFWKDASGADSDAAEEAFDRLRELDGTRALLRDAQGELPAPIVYRVLRENDFALVDVELFRWPDGRTLLGRKDHPVVYEIRSGDRSSLLRIAPE